MNKQEIFNAVASHLLCQGERSIAETFEEDAEQVCMYRGLGNLKCGFGALIPDALYHEGLENQVASSDEVVEVLIQAGVLEKKPNRDMELFLIRLQDVHDDVEPIEWQAELRQFALRHELDWEFNFKFGDCEGRLPGTKRRWTIEYDGQLYTVWYDGCEHGGDYPSYGLAVAAVNPFGLGD